MITKKEIREAVRTKEVEEMTHCTHVTSDENYNNIRKAMNEIQRESETKKEYIDRLYNYLNK